MKRKKLVWLLGINLFISAFTFGGGYVVIPMIRKAFVQKKKLFTEQELMDMAAVAQSSPGAIAVNLSVLAGYRTAGIVGAAISCVAAVIPPIVILSVVSAGYAAFRDSNVVSAVLKGMEAGVAALIVDLVIDLCRAVFREKRLLCSLLVPCAFVLSFCFHIHVALVIAAGSALCVIEVLLKKERGTVS